MQLCYVQLPGGPRAVGLVQGDELRVLDGGHASGIRRLSDLLHADEPLALASRLWDQASESAALGNVTLLAPIDDQEVWGAGVTYKRSQVARREESQGGGSFYDKVYTAERPELFLTATPGRVVGPGQA